jgi:hypothetical protein
VKRMPISSLQMAASAFMYDGEPWPFPLVSLAQQVQRRPHACEPQRASAFTSSCRRLRPESPSPSLLLEGVEVLLGHVVVGRALDDETVHDIGNRNRPGSNALGIGKDFGHDSRASCDRGSSWPAGRPRSAWQSRLRPRVSEGPTWTSRACTCAPDRSCGRSRSRPWTPQPLPRLRLPPPWHPHLPGDEHHGRVRRLVVHHDAHVAEHRGDGFDRIGVDELLRQVVV